MASFLFFRKRDVRGIHHWLVVLNAMDLLTLILHENKLPEKNTVALNRN